MLFQTRVLLLPGLILLAVSAIVFLRAFLERSSSTARFKAKKVLLSAPEQVLYNRLAKSLPDCNILSQVSFSQFIYAVGGEGREAFSKYNRARQKVADFVVCGRGFDIVAVIELDDSSHNAEKDAQRDAILREAGIRTVRWRTTKMPDEAEIRAAILPQSKQTSA